MSQITASLIALEDTPFLASAGAALLDDPSETLVDALLGLADGVVPCLIGDEEEEDEDWVDDEDEEWADDEEDEFLDDDEFEDEDEFDDDDEEEDFDDDDDDEL